jgi:arylsulfatase A-like enzyme
MCAGPGILKGKTVSTPVATMDMAGTFMDYADATPEPHMTTRSFRGILEGKAGAIEDYRPYVSSGLSNFRMVVQQMGEKQYKYICCQGSCPNPPSTAPMPKDPEGFVEMLIDIIADPYDMKDLAPTHRDVVEKMRPMLPEAYAHGCATAAAAAPSGQGL